MTKVGNGPPAFYKHLHPKSASLGLLIRLLHLQTDQLDNCSKEKISRSADPCNKNQLQLTIEEYSTTQQPSKRQRNFQKTILQSPPLDSLLAVHPAHLSGE